MKGGKGGFVTNALKANVQAGPKAMTSAIPAGPKSGGKAAPKSAIKPKQKSMPMASGKKLGNHYGNK